MLSIIMPAYNEGEYIYRNLHEIIKSFKRLKMDFEIILVNDGSTDNTYEEARLVNSKFVKIVSYDKNKGKGYALKKGFEHASGDYVTFLDSDLDIHPKNLMKFFIYMKFFDADFVYGSKRHPLSKVDYPLKRRILSWAYHKFVNFLFDLKVTDTQTGLKLIKYECLKEILPKIVVKRYAFDLELMVAARYNNYSLIEAPVELKYQYNGSSVNYKAIKNIFRDTIAIAYRLYIIGQYGKKKYLQRLFTRVLYRVGI